MKFLKFLVDHSTALLALLTAGFNLLAAFGLELTSEQVGAINSFAVLAIALLSEAFRTASSNVVSFVSGGEVQVGHAGVLSTGTTVDTVPEPQTNAPVAMVAVKPDLLNAA